MGLQVVAAMGAGGPVVDLGGGCGPGGLLTTQGPCALGNPAFQVELFVSVRRLREQGVVSQLAFAILAACTEST